MASGPFPRHRPPESFLQCWAVGRRVESLRWSPVPRLRPFLADQMLTTTASPARVRSYGSRTGLGATAASRASLPERPPAALSSVAFQVLTSRADLTVWLLDKSWGHQPLGSTRALLPYRLRAFTVPQDEEY